MDDMKNSMRSANKTTVLINPDIQPALHSFPEKLLRRHAVTAWKSHKGFGLKDFRAKLGS
jgi:hypothetical protein